MSRLSRICDVSPDCRDRFKDFRDLKVLKIISATRLGGADVF